MRNNADLTGKSIAVFLQSISGGDAINLLVAFYDKQEETERCYSFVLSRTPHETIGVTFRGVGTMNVNVKPRNSIRAKIIGGIKKLYNHH
jgi:hypothetical protein